MAPPLRPKSSSLGSDIRGDTGAPAVSTLTPETHSAPRTPSPRPGAPKHSKRRKARSLFRRWKSFSLKHTWVNPLIIILVVLFLYALNPTPSNPVYGAIFLSYPLSPTSPLIPTHVRADPAAPPQYGKGPADAAFVAFYIVVLSFTREFLMQRFVRPLAQRAGIHSRAKQSRFMEQAYTALYFSVFGPLGLYVMRRTPVWYFETGPMYDDFPHRAHDAVFKAYYLLQASYWAQQAIVLLLLLEKPRKDFKELVGHHIVTLLLIGLSYRFHFTYIGVAVYITHDISDFFIATSKILNYLRSPITVPYFVFFVGVWIYLRHYINLRILVSVLTDFSTRGPFELDWAAEQYKCWISQAITFILLAALQAINLFWLFLILRIAWNAVFTDVARDERSEDEYTEEEKLVAEREHTANGGAKEGRAPRSAVASGAQVALPPATNGRAREPRVQGSAIESDAARQENESYADAVKEGLEAR